MSTYNINQRIDGKYGVTELNLDDGSQCMSVAVTKLWAKPVSMPKGSSYSDAMNALIASINETRAELDAMEQRYTVARDFYDITGVVPEEI